jgi:hypothetical protein
LRDGDAGRHFRIVVAGLYRSRLPPDPRLDPLRDDTRFAALVEKYRR